MPAELSIKAMVQIDTGVVVCLRFIVTNGAGEQLSSLVRDPLTGAY